MLLLVAASGNRRAMGISSMPSQHSSHGQRGRNRRVGLTTLVTAFALALYLCPCNGQDSDSVVRVCFVQFAPFIYPEEAIGNITSSALEDTPGRDELMDRDISLADFRRWFQGLDVDLITATFA